MAAGVSEQFTMLARTGYAARGVVYLIIGGFALLAAFGQGGQTTGSRGALESLLGEPFGKILLGLIAIGLAGYALWRAVQAIMDADDHGSDAKALAIRSGLAVSAITHSLLAVFALSLVFGWGAGGGGSSQHWTSWLMQQPFGRWLIGLVGVAVVGAGIAHIWKGWTAKFEKHLEMARDLMRTLSPICRFGLVARGVVFLIIGGFFIAAAVRFSSSEARGLDGALDALQQQPYGWILLGVVALGLVAFGIYGLIEARYRRIDHPVG